MTLPSSLFQWAFIIGFGFLGIVIVMTLIMVCIFKCNKCDKCCNSILGLVYSFTVLVSVVLLTPKMVLYLNIPMDFPLYAFFAYNVVATAVICFTWKGPKLLIQIIQVMNMHFDLNANIYPA